MKRHLAALIALVLFFSPELARSLERSGEVIREIMNAVDSEMTAMEKQGEILTKSRKSLLKALEGDYETFKAEADPGKRQFLAADMQLTMAKLNAQETKEVDAYLSTLEGLIPKMERLKREMTKGGGIPGFESSFSAYRVRMGNFMTRTVGILDEIEQGATEAVKRKITGLKALLVSTYYTLAPASSESQTSVQRLDEIQGDLENALLQLLNIKRMLEQERLELQVTSELVLAELVLERLNKGPLSNGRFFKKPEGLKRGLEKRQGIREEIHRKASGGAGKRGEASSSPSGSPDEQALDRIRRGEYDWKGR